MMIIQWHIQITVCPCMVRVIVHVTISERCDLHCMVHIVYGMFK